SMRYNGLTRMLALDLHPRHFGYVVVESPDRLLDWGVRSNRYKDGSTDPRIRQFRSILNLWKPTRVVIQHPPTMMPRVAPRSRLLCRIVKEAKNHHIAIRMGRKRPGGPTK